MLKVSKVLVLSLLVVGLCAPLALATTSRVQSLAGASSYINDDSDIFRWYGTLPSYSKMVMAEAGQYNGIGADYQALGFTHNWGEDHWLGTWGVFLMTNSIEDGSFFAFNPLPTPGQGPTLGNPVPSTKFALAWGKDIGVLSLGLMFTRSDESIKETGVDEVNYNFTTLGGGVRWDINESAYGDAAVTLGFAGGTPTPTVGWDKSSSFNVEGRLFWEVVDNATLVPYIGYQSADFALETDAVTNPAPTGDSWSNFTFGASFDFDVNTNNLLIFAADIQSFNWKYSKSDGDKSEWNQFVFPRFYVALESDVASWFTFRVGATKTMAKTTVTNPAGEETEYTYAIAIIDDEIVRADDFTWHLGGGFHVGEWDIDAVFSHEIPFRLGYWLTGYGVDNPEPIVSRVSATYRF
jgi:hypothetical protein